MGGELKHGGPCGYNGHGWRRTAGSMCSPRYFCHFCICLQFSIKQNKLVEMCCMNDRVSTPFPLTLPVTKHMLFGFVLPLVIKLSIPLSKEFSHFSRNLLLRWVSTLWRHGSREDNLLRNGLLYKNRKLFSL